MAKEIDFRNRVSKYPGRVVLSPVSGQANTYDMARADEPTEAGTPIDKAAFDSIIHSRLTGRYYQLAVSRDVMTSTTGQTDPAPASGWIEADYTNFEVNGVKLTSSYPDYPNLAPRAFDNSSTTYFAAESDSGETWVAIDFGTRILVTEITVAWFSYDNDYFRVSFQGSNNGGASWTEIANTTGNRENATAWAFSNSTEYSAYRLVFTQGTESAMRLYEWSFTGWRVNVYKNVFTADGLATEWTEGQRVMIETPANVNTVGVLANALNGVIINTILQPSKLYELCFRNSAFVAREV